MTDPLSRRVPTVDIILGVYNRPDLAADCIESLLTYTNYPRWRLILIDDASDAFTHEHLTGYAAKHPQITFLHNPENLGFIGTYNRGMSNSDADYVVLLNSDTVMSPGWLGKLVDVAESDPRIGMVNPLSNELVNLTIPMAPGTSFLAMNELLERYCTRGPFNIVTAIGFCLLIRREALQRHGDLDNIYGRGYCEDTDLHMRLTTNGWCVVAAPNTYIYHVGHGSFSTAVAHERFQQNYRIFRERWGEQYDRDFKQFQAADPIVIVRRHFQPRQNAARRNPLQKDSVAKSEGRLRRALRLVIKHRGKLLRAALRPRQAVAKLRSHLDAPPQVQPIGGVATRRPYYERHTSHTSPSVVFVLHELSLYGGVLKVIGLINQLILQGVEARLAVATNEPYPREILQLAYFEPMFFNDYQDLVQNLPACDVAVATFFTSVRCVQSLVNQGRARAGVNYLQDFDGWFTKDEHVRKTVLSTYPLLENRVVTSEWLQGLLNDRGFRSTVIPLGFNALQFYPMLKPEMVALRVIAMARPQTPYRGFDDLVEVLRRVRSERPDTEIVLFGDENLQDVGKIDFPFVDLGIIKDRSELCRQYNESDVFVDTSHFQGFGLPALEAMSCKVACVLTNVGGVNQYARNGINALMVPPHNPEACSAAIIRLLDDHSLRTRLGNRGRKTVERMLPRDEAKAFIDYFAKVCPSFRKSLPASSRRLRAA